MNSFWVGGVGGQKACLPAHSEEIRCHQLVPPCWELLRSLSRLKRTENNGRRWIQSDVIKSRKMSLYSPVLKPFHAASCLSVSPSKKSWQNGPEYSLWCLPRIHIKDMGNQETESRISDSTWSGKCCLDILLFHPTTIDYRDNWKTWQPLEFHFNAATEEQAGRPTGPLFWPPTPFFLQGKGSFVCISHAVSDARVIPGPTLSSAGFHKSRAAAATAVTVTTTENVIYSKHWNTANSTTGTRLCRHFQGQWLKVKPQICHTMI